MHLSVVIPAFNEEKRIEEALRRVTAFLDLKGRPYEVIVSSNGSTDATERLVRAFAEAHPEAHVGLVASGRNRGKGASVRRGVLASSGAHVLVTDADLSAPIKESDKLMAALEAGYDAAIGSRAVRSPGADVQQSLKRRIAGRVFNGLVRLFALKRFGDTQCGFKCFKRPAALELFREQVISGFAFDVEVLLRAQRAGLRVKEVPIMWREGRSSKVSLLKDPLIMLRDVIELKKRLGPPA